MGRILIIQVLMVIFSLAGVLVKMAGEAWAMRGFWSVQTLIYVIASVLLMMVYAIFWQIIIKHLSLTLAYFNRATVIFWGLFWAILIFGESITFFNVLGAVFILTGLVLVNRP